MSITIKAGGGNSNNPYVGATEDYQARADVWRMVNDEARAYARDVLPPIYVDGGGFMVSEASGHDGRGVPCYLCVVQVDGSNYARIVAEDRARAEIDRLRAMLKAVPS